MQAIGCAALCAFGATSGVLTALAEVSLHANPAAMGVALASAIGCGGVVLGVWFPRRVIRRRLRRLSSAPEIVGSERASRAAGLEFASSVSGILIVALAAAVLLLVFASRTMESYRALLTTHTLLPLGLVRGLLWGPVCLLLASVGFAGTATLVALHGWYRQATEPRTRVWRLWLGILAAACAAGFFAATPEARPVLALLPPLAVFAAGAVAGLRTRAPTAERTPAAAVQSLSRREFSSLAAVGVAAFALGVAWFVAQIAHSSSGASIGLSWAALAGGATCGLLAGRLLLMLRRAEDAGLLALLLAGITLAHPLGHYEPNALVALALTAFCVSACVVLIGRTVARTCGSVQYALSRLGAVAATGFGLALAICPPTSAFLDTPRIAVTVSLLSVAAAGLCLLTETRALRSVRIAGVLVTTCWLVWLPAFAPESRLRQAGVAASDADSTNPFARMFERSGLRTAHASLNPSDRGGVWSVDLYHRDLELLILDTLPEPLAPDQDSAESLQRVWRRIDNCLTPGGRVVVFLPTVKSLLDWTIRRDPNRLRHRWAVHRAVFSDGDAPRQALIFGADTPRWTAHLASGELGPIALYPWPAQSTPHAAHPVGQTSDVVRSPR